MRILQVTKYYYPAVSFGGPVQCTRNLTRYLTKNGHDVTVYTTDALYPKSRDRISSRVQIIDGAEVHFFRNLARVFEMFITPDIFGALRRTLATYDVVHLHEYRTFQNIAFLLCRNQPPYVVQTHGIKLPEFAVLEGKSSTVFPRRAYNAMFGNRLLKRASRVIALTKFERGLLEQGGVESGRILVIPNGVSPEDFRKDSGWCSFRDRLGITGSKVILYVGRISKAKGVDTLVKAFYLMGQARNDAKLIIVGPDDGYQNTLMGLARRLRLEGKVLFVGALSHEEVVAAYSCAYLVVYPSLYEGFPIVPLEAAAMGKPLVVSNDPGMNFVREGGFGLTFDYGNEHQLARCLEKLLEDHKLARRLGEDGRRHVFQNYTWDIVGKKVEDLYQQILSRTKLSSGTRSGGERWDQ